MFYPSIKDFFQELTKLDLPINVVYPSKSDKEIILKENFYPQLVDFLLESEQIKSNKTLIEDCDMVISPDGTKIDMAKLNNDMTIAKVAIINQAALFGPYVNQLVPIYTFQIKTMATDGVRLFVNPQFANNLKYEHKIFVLMHEIMHCVLNHRQRQMGRNATLQAQGKDSKTGKPINEQISLWNVAADYEINALIVDTIPSFTEQTLKDINGLYDKKYLNQAAEPIYDEIYKNTPKINMPPQPGDGEPESGGEDGNGKGGNEVPEITVGSKVRIKSSGEKGIVTQINQDGTYEVSPEGEVSESFNNGVSNIDNASIATYRREDLIPILPGKAASGGEGDGDSGDQVEYEDGYSDEGESDKGESDGDDDDGDGDGQARGFKDGKEVDLAEAGMKTNVTVEADPGNTGTMISEEQGKRLAENSGHTPTDDGDTERKWKNNARKLLEDIEKGEKSGGAGSGSGFDMLKSALKKLFPGDVNWKEEFAKFVANALSPEKQWRLGNRRHMRAGQKILRYGLKQKRDSINNVVVLVDVSGSMSMTWQARILNEINQIIFSKKVKEITVIFFDSKVDIPSIQKLKGGQKPWLPEDIPGGQGTMFQEPLDYVEKHYKSPSLVVFATDGYNYDSGKLIIPKFANKFIWLLYGGMDIAEMRKRFPWGKIIKIADKDDK